VKHAFVKLEKDGAISIRWWVDTSEGVATRTLIHVRPGESAFDLDFDDWRQHLGCFVDLDELRHRALVRPGRN
jgi:hypothetical protein